MKKVEIVAQAFDPKDGSAFGNARTEIIDLETNILFKECKTLTDVVETYMRFWNRLLTKQVELVLVQSIKEV